MRTCRESGVQHVFKERAGDQYLPPRLSLHFSPVRDAPEDIFFVRWVVWKRHVRFPGNREGIFGYGRAEHFPYVSGQKFIRIEWQYPIGLKIRHRFAHHGGHHVRLIVRKTVIRPERHREAFAHQAFQDFHGIIDSAMERDTDRGTKRRMVAHEGLEDIALVPGPADGDDLHERCQYRSAYEQSIISRETISARASSFKSILSSV